ncbi:MAG TPA: shikimate dehydrogenase [Gammaproteobacteria bacterium]|nr:shikimate dehydrogenase [Gammaproteobacteria bacterium]
MDHYAVMGNPIAHSKSPRIHSLFAEQTGQELDYRAILVEKDEFPQAVRHFRDEGGKGLNVTVPFKQQAWELAETRSPEAERAGAVNTLAFREDGAIYGHNTDGIGLLRDLTDNLGLDLAHRRVLVLGAGGAVRGVLQPLLEAKPERLTIANRTVARASELADAFADLGPIEACGFDALGGKAFDLVINGTAASLEGEVPPIPESAMVPDTVCYDMMYGTEPTAFMRWAERHGGHGRDGLGMLVEQAAESFLLWRGVRPDTADVIRSLRGALAAA